MKNPANSAALNAKSLCFYSGSTVVTNPTLKPPKAAPVKAYKLLKQFKSKHNCNSVQDIISSFGQTSQRWKTDPDWMQVSGVLAQHATGTAYILLGKTVSTDSVWAKAEKPALIANGGVTRVEIYEIDGKGDIIAQANLKG